MNVHGFVALLFVYVVLSRHSLGFHFHYQMPCHLQCLYIVRGSNESSSHLSSGSLLELVSCVRPF